MKNLVGLSQTKIETKMFFQWYTYVCTPRYLAHACKLGSFFFSFILSSIALFFLFTDLECIYETITSI